MRADRAFRLGCGALAMLVSQTLRAQVSRWQSEGRIETLVSRTTAVHAAVGINTVAGTYLRIALLGAAGTRHVRDEWRRSGRIDLVGRFHVDPQRQYAHGLYVLAGATALLDDGVSTRVRAVAGIGLEGRVHGGWIFGAEAGVGGGARLATTVRRARKIGR